MATNETITASLVAGTVPPDVCVKSAQDVVNVVEAYMSIQSSTGEIPQGPSDSIASQALNAANNALAQIAALQSQLKQRRTLAPQPVPTGDGQFAFSWTDPMPSLDYEVIVTLYAGTNSHPAAYYGWRVLESSITLNGVTILTDNIPASTKASILVIER